MANSAGAITRRIVVDSKGLGVTVCLVRGETKPPDESLVLSSCELNFHVPSLPEWIIANVAWRKRRPVNMYQVKVVW